MTDATQAAKEIVVWIKSQPNGTAIGYDDILSEVQKRFHGLEAADRRFITDKAIRLLALS